MRVRFWALSASLSFVGVGPTISVTPSEDTSMDAPLIVSLVVSSELPCSVRLSVAAILVHERRRISHGCVGGLEHPGAVGFLLGTDHVDHRVDQRQMGERLREVAHLSAGARLDLLGVEVPRAG